MERIVLDTNFLMIPYKFRVDIFSEFERICNFNYKVSIFEHTINELKNIIKSQSGIDKKAAQFGLKLVKLKDINMIKSDEKDVDSSILCNADKGDIIATQDTKLKKQLLEKGASVIILRQRKYLQLIERKFYKGGDYPKSIDWLKSLK